MIKDGEYRVLSRDTLEDMIELTGKTKNELEEMLKECENFGSVQVFWREFNRWFTFKVSGEYVFYGLLDSVVKEIMGRHARRT